jgi:hypothetical protein
MTLQPDGINTGEVLCGNQGHEGWIITQYIMQG